MSTVRERRKIYENVLLKTELLVEVQRLEIKN